MPKQEVKKVDQRQERPSASQMMLSSGSSSHEIIQYLNKVNNHLDEILIENYGEIDEVAASLIDKIDSLEEVAEKKAERIANVYHAIEKAKAFVEGQRSYHYNKYKQYRKQKKFHSNAEDRLTTKMGELMNAAGVKSFDINGNKVSLGTSYKLEVYDEPKALETLPKEFVKTKFSIKKGDLKKHLDNDENLGYEGVRIAKNHYVRGL